MNIRQLKPNILHQKYIETSQINNIPGPSITKRTEDKKTGVDYDEKNNNKNCYKYYSKSYYDNISNNQYMKKKSYALKNTDIESFQRKVFRDFNSNVACLPGVTINEKEKTRTLVATNSKKNESHISLGFTDSNENKNNNYFRSKYDYNKKNMNEITRAKSFSGKRIIRDRNKESNPYSQIINSKINRTGYPYSNERNIYEKNYGNNFYQKHVTDKNKSQIIFG